MFNTNLNEEVFNKLPQLLKDCVNTLQTNEEKEIFLLSSVVALSSTMENVSTLHEGRTIHPMLYCFIVAPPASNKGVAKYAETLVEAIDENQFSNNSNLLIGGNSSGAGMARMLNENNGTGLVFETEADVISNVFDKEWGSDLSTAFRKAFHHEPIRIDRKKSEDSIRIKQPKLALMLTGTYNQVPILLKSSTDGLLSRFLFYTLPEDSEFVWQDTGDDVNSVDNTEEVTKDMGAKYLKMWSKFKKQRVIFYRTEQQQAKSREYFEGEAVRINEYKDSYRNSLLKRHGVMLKRIAMTLSALRYMEEAIMFEEGETKLPYYDDDFNIALDIVQACFPMAEGIYNALGAYTPNNSTNKETEWDKALKVYNCIPKGVPIKCEEVHKIVSQKYDHLRGFSKRTVDSRLTLLKEKGMFDIRYPQGTYFIPLNDDPKEDDNTNKVQSHK